MQSFAILKPSVAARYQTQTIIKFIESKGFDIIKQESRCITLKEAKDLYAEHAEQEFFLELCNYMTKGIVTLLLLYNSSGDCVEKFREIVGINDASDGKTIRGIFGISKRENAIHASDSIESYERESKIFFDSFSEVIVSNKRLSVYQAIESERDYQEYIGEKLDYFSLEAEILMMEEYLLLVRKTWTNSKSDESVLDILRKSIGIGVRCLENHGAPRRIFQRRIEL